MNEIEAKAWIKTPEEKQQTLKYLEEKQAEYRGEYIKEDLYFGNTTDKEIAFRLRTQSHIYEDTTKNSFLVTQKTRSYSLRGVEQNNEREFEVIEKQQFQSFMESLGFVVIHTKHKKTFFYTLENINIEIVEIDTLGSFLEVEILASDDEIKNAEEKIYQIFIDLNLEKNIEKTPYFKLQKNK